LTNQGTIETDGIDLSVNYSLDTGLGTLYYTFNGNWTNSSTFQASPTSINRECVGFYSINCGSPQPEYMINQRATLSANMAGRPVDVSLLWRYIDEMNVEPEVASAFLPQFRQISAEHYFDLSVRADLTDQLQFTAAVLNMMNEEPKVVGSNIGTTAFNSGNIYASTYDPLGRRFSLTLAYRM
jgi:outer membrane receptor protein involved in Fe transport